MKRKTGNCINALRYFANSILPINSNLEKNSFTAERMQRGREITHFFDA